MAGSIGTGRSLMAAFGLALGVRVAVAWLSGPAQPNEIRYITIGRGILSGAGYVGLDRRFPDIIQPPLHPLTLAGALLLPGPELGISRGVSILIGSLLVYPGAFLAQRLFGQKAARRAALLIASYPLLAHTSSSALSEPSFTMLVLMGVLTLWRALDLDDRLIRLFHFLGAGTLLGASFLTRPEGLAFLVVAVAVLVLALRSGGASWLAIGRAGGCLLGGFAIAVLPYLLWIHGRTGQWLPAPKATLAWVHHALIQEGRREGWKEPFGSTYFFERVKFGLNDDASAIRSHELFATASGAPVVDIPGSEDSGVVFSELRSAASLVVRNLMKLYLETAKNGYVLPLLLLVLGGLGLTSRPWAGPFRRPALIVLAFLLGSLSFMLTLVVPRYLYSAVVLALPWVAEGWRRVEVWLLASVSGAGARHPTAGNKRFVRVAVGVVVIGLTGVHLVPAVRITHGLWAEHKELGLWLGQMAGQERTVMAATPIVSYYAGAAFEVLPYADLDDVLRYARHKRAEFLVADAHEIRTHRPQLAMLLTPDRRHPGLELMKALHEGTPDAIYLYRLTP